MRHWQEWHLKPLSVEQKPNSKKESNLSYFIALCYFSLLFTFLILLILRHAVILNFILTPFSANCNAKGGIELFQIIFNSIWIYRFFPWNGVSHICCTLFQDIILTSRSATFCINSNVFARIGFVVCSTLFWPRRNSKQPLYCVWLCYASAQCVCSQWLMFAVTERPSLQHLHRR